MKQSNPHQKELGALKAVLDAGMSYAEAKASEILAQVNSAVSKLESQVLEIKIGDLDKVKLKSQAHPQLKRIIQFAEIANKTNSKHPYLVGPAGSGKTQVAAQAAEALGQRFGHISLTAGASETWLWGRQTPTGFNNGQFADFYENGGVFLFDELDAADANLLIALNTALANGSAYNPISGKKITRHKDFYCIAAGNTFGLGADFAFTGRNRLDASTLDRFAPIVVDFLPEIEALICPDKDLAELLQTIREVLREEQNPNVKSISYRAFSWSYAAFKLGIDIEDILQSITGSWPEGLLKNTLSKVEAKLEAKAKKSSKPKA